MNLRPNVRALTTTQSSSTGREVRCEALGHGGVHMNFRALPACADSRTRDLRAGRAEAVFASARPYTPRFVDGCASNANPRQTRPRSVSNPRRILPRPVSNPWRTLAHSVSNPFRYRPFSRPIRHKLRSFPALKPRLSLRAAPSGCDSLQSVGVAHSESCLAGG